MISIIDYGIGNLRSIKNAFDRFGVETKITFLPTDIKNSKAIVLPGIGSIISAAVALSGSKLGECVCDEIKNGKPTLAICLGLHILFEKCEDDSGMSLLGILRGKIKKFQHSLNSKILHIGWNTVEIKINHRIFDGILNNSFFYFSHSLYAEPAEEAVVLAETSYGITFPSVIVKNNIIGTQFHPEKSHKVGMKFIENFLKIANAC